MDKNKVLDDIFNDDPLGLLNVKAKKSSARTSDERLASSFDEINDFIEKHEREPEPNPGNITEYKLYSRLKSLRKDEEKMMALEPQDKYGLLNVEKKEINSIDDIFEDDMLGIFDDENADLFEFKHTPKPDERAQSDFVARRKPCKDFDKYDEAFKEVQSDLASGKRRMIPFKETLLKPGNFYVNAGLLLYLESVDYEGREWSRGETEGNRIREFKDGRTRTVFENGTESEMYFRSLAKALIMNGKAVTQNLDKANEELLEGFSNITEEDEASGYIYILKSLSEGKDIKSKSNLYKIGYSKKPVPQRIKDAEKEPTYLMAPVELVAAYKCYNMNTQKFEQLIHNFLGASCLEVDVFDASGRRHTPREWFIAPLDIIEQAITLIISGEVVKYAYDTKNEVIIEKPY